MQIRHDGKMQACWKGCDVSIFASNVDECPNSVLFEDMPSYIAPLVHHENAKKHEIPNLVTETIRVNSTCLLFYGHWFCSCFPSLRTTSIHSRSEPSNFIWNLHHSGPKSSHFEGSWQYFGLIRFSEQTLIRIGFGADHLHFVWSWQHQLNSFLISAICSIYLYLLFFLLLFLAFWS